jgi:hypothetical protein
MDRIICPSYHFPSLSSTLSLLVEEGIPFSHIGGNHEGFISDLQFLQDEDWCIYKAHDISEFLTDPFMIVLSVISVA